MTVHPPVPGRPDEQIAVGDIPREPVAFQARSQLVAEIDDVFARSSVAVVCALAGGRGVGKTQVAAAVVRAALADGCPLAAWVSGDTADALLSGLAATAERLGVADPDGDSAASARRLRTSLELRTAPAVLVVDNGTDPDMIAALLPSTGPTRVIVTTTDRAFSNVGRIVDVDVYTAAEAVAFLVDRTGLRDEDGAQRLAAELGRHPLALAQAAAVIAARRWTYAQHLEHLRRVEVDRALVRAAGQPYPHGTAEAILLALDTVGQTGESCTPGGQNLAVTVERVLRLLAVLSPDGVRRDLLDRIAGLAPGEAQAAVDACARASVLTFTGTRSTGQVRDIVTVHRLVGRVIRERAHRRGELAAAVADGIAVLDQALVPEDQAWAHREALRDLPDHLGALAAAAAGGGMSKRRPAVLDLMDRAVRHLVATADLTRARNLGRRALADRQQVSGPDHPDTFGSASNLATAYEAAGRLAEATTLFERTLADRRRVLGPQHPDTLASALDLAFAYESAGRFAEATTLFERTLADRRRVLGPRHPDTLAAANNLAFAYESTGRIDEATALFERTLADRRVIQGDDHPSTLSSAHNLAGVYESAGRLADATDLYESTYAVRRVILGEDHPHTLNSANNLAYTYVSAGRFAAAIDLHERTLADRKRVLGEDHPSTLNSANNLARAYRSSGRLAEAAELYERTLADRRRVLGDDHPETRNSADDLAATRSLLQEATAPAAGADSR